MTRSELIQKLNQRFNSLTYQDVEISTKYILEAIAERLCKGSRVEIRGFGSSRLNYRPPRSGRNPMTGTKVSVPEKYVPHFKPGVELRQRVNK